MKNPLEVIFFKEIPHNLKQQYFAMINYAGGSWTPIQKLVEPEASK